MEDSYSRLINIMQKHGAKYNPPSIDIGIVISDEPLTVKIGDLPLIKDNVLVADSLLENYTRQFEADGTIKTYTMKDGLKKDDLVACLSTQDRQTYIILCKVVKP